MRDAGEDDEALAIEIRLFLEAVNQRYGYDLRGYSAASMRRRVLAALAKSGLSHLGALQHEALHDPQFFLRVLEDLTVRVSEMFRDPSFYFALRERVVPVLRTYPLLRIWHGGCALGEEAYATAILLMEEGLYDRAQIYATDLSATAIAQAKTGVFSEQQLATFSENYQRSGGKGALMDYYTEGYGGFAMNEEVRRNVHFFQHNLVSDHVFGEMQLIFCRNVLIYFGADLRDKVMAKLTESLCPGGFLCLGSSEAMSGAHADAYASVVAEERIYRRVG